MIWIESVQESDTQRNLFEKWNNIDHIINTLHRVQLENHLDRYDMMRYSAGLLQGIADIDPTGTFSKKDIWKLTSFFERIVNGNSPHTDQSLGTILSDL
ncbi:MAG: hypothetical protein RHS_2644 [Robinsoniella sp. RHS]|uniref:hypothetical protein n=1 Tax=Robinsoniella sp. RHS TaxID=1504536 RepID=UPI000649E883|nr:MAG: hypothetical protein RHS_2644 [Robinsoniella sp. RHS]